MSLEVKELGLSGVLLVTPKRHVDPRGFFSETYNQRALSAEGIDFHFVQDNHSLSAQRGTVRGLHFQVPPRAQNKLVRVLRGAVLDVAVDIRKGSPSFGRHVAVELSAANWHQLLIPCGFAHGFCTLEPETEVLYKVTDFYARECDTGILWNDPALEIPWPAFAGTQVSDKDQELPRLEEFNSPFYSSSAEV